jgi:hypothetical protein
MNATVSKLVHEGDIPMLLLVDFRFTYRAYPVAQAARACAPV